MFIDTINYNVVAMSINNGPTSSKSVPREVLSRWSHYLAASRPPPYRVDCVFQRIAQDGVGNNKTDAFSY